MDTDSRRMRPVLDNGRDIFYAVEQMSRFADDQESISRLMVEHFAVDLDLLAAALSTQDTSHDYGYRYA